MELYESTYNEKQHFSFGKNWKNFLTTLNEERIENAKKSLVDFLGGEDNIRGKSFVDIGCGSGLFSLAAVLLGASRVVSVDVDQFSVECARYLREKQNNPAHWEIKEGSALDQNFINSLGKFDVVYSWGVLHHTGNMYAALGNVSQLISPKGVFFLAIYNRNKTRLREGTSEFWVKMKRFYNSCGSIEKRIITYLYISYFVAGLIILGRNPVTYIRNYKSNRGMNWYNDIVDWLGGHPYEFASPDEMVNFFGERGLGCKKMIYRDGIGCSEYLLMKCE